MQASGVHPADQSSSYVIDMPFKNGDGDGGKDGGIRYRVTSKQNRIGAQKVAADI